MGSSRFPAVVDDVTVRLVAAVVLVVGLAALATQAWWLYALLAVDFVLRSAVGPRTSPVARAVQRWVRPRVAAPRQPTPGPPKRFAAAIGAVMTSAAAALTLWHATGGPTGAHAAALAVGVVMVVFPALEALLGICVGCLLFAGLMRLGVVPEEVCVECADITKRRARLITEREGRQAA